MTARLFSAFVAVETFLFLAREDRWAVLFFFTQETWLLVALLWLKNLALAAGAGFVAGRLLTLTVRAAARAEGEAPPPPPPLAEAAWVVPILALGGALRWVFRAWNPPGLWIDVVYAAQPLFGGAGVPFWGVSPFGENRAHFEVVSNLYVTFVRGVFAAFGSSEAGFFAVSALPGALFVPAAWWLAREASGPRVAWIAALFAALLGWPILLARWSSTAALLLVLVAVAGAAVLRARRTSNAALAALAGACVGLSLHTHASAGAVAAGFGAFALHEARDPRGRRLVLAAAAAAALAFAPLAWGFLSGGGRTGGHLRDVHVGTPTKQVDAPRAPGFWRIPAAVAANAADYAGALLWTVDPNERNAAGRRALTPAVGALALLGLGLAATRRSPAERLLLCLAAGSLLAGVLSNPDAAPNTLRICALLVPAVVLAAAALDAFLAGAARSGFLSRGVLAAGVAAALLVFETAPALLAAPERPGVAPRFCTAETDAGRLLARLAGAPVVLEKDAVLYGVVAEAVAHGADREKPLDVWPRRSAADLLAEPPAGPAWLYASRSTRAALAAGGLRVGRGIAPSEVRPDLVLARVGARR